MRSPCHPFRGIWLSAAYAAIGIGAHAEIGAHASADGDCGGCHDSGHNPLVSARRYHAFKTVWSSAHIMPACKLPALQHSLLVSLVQSAAVQRAPGHHSGSRCERLGFRSHCTSEIARHACVSRIPSPQPLITSDRSPCKSCAHLHLPIRSAGTAGQQLGHGHASAGRRWCRGRSRVRLRPAQPGGHCRAGEHAHHTLEIHVMPSQCLHPLHGFLPYKWDQTALPCQPLVTVAMQSLAERGASCLRLHWRRPPTCVCVGAGGHRHLPRAVHGVEHIPCGAAAHLEELWQDVRCCPVWNHYMPFRCRRPLLWDSSGPDAVIHTIYVPG